MMEKNNFILRLKARQALAGHWQTALVVMLVASLPSWLAQIASLVQGGGLQQQLLMVLQYGNPELLADPQYLLRLVEGQLGSARLLSNVLSVLSFLVTPMFTLGLIHFFLELLHGRKDQSWTAAFSRVKTGLKGLGVELLTLVKMLLWAVPGLCCMGIITYLAMTVDSVSRHGLSWMVTLTIVSYAATIIPAVIAYFRYALSMFFLADHPDWSCRACVKASIASMSHQKLNLFLMQLSFLGWSILISLVSNMALFMLGNVLCQALYLGLNLALSVYMNCSLCAFYLAWGTGADPIREAGENGTVV